MASPHSQALLAGYVLEEGFELNPPTEGRSVSKSQGNAARVSWSKRKIAWALKRMEGTSWWAFFLWQLLVADSLLICVGLLVVKATGSDVLSSPASLPASSLHFAELSAWPLQMANVLLVISYSLSNYLHLRLCLSLACLSFMIFAATAPFGVILDMLFFNWAMALLNLYHAFMHVYNQRYVEFPPDFEQVYCSRFKEFMSRTEFETLCSIALVRRSSADIWMKKMGDEVTSLCVLVSGRVGTYKGDGSKIDEHGPMDILEAPEWVRSGLNPEEQRFDASMKVESSEGAVYLKWPRESLVQLLDKNPAMKTAMRAVLGIQTALVWTRTTKFASDHAVSAVVAA